MVPGGGSSAPVTGTVTGDHLSETRGISWGESTSTGTFCPTICPTVYVAAPQSPSATSWAPCRFTACLHEYLPREGEQTKATTRKKRRDFLPGNTVGATGSV